MLKSKIESRYTIHDKCRITQGDILRDFKFHAANLNSQNIELREFTFTYLIIISQDCDLENCNNNTPKDGLTNQFLPNILTIPAFPDEELRSGKHYSEMFGITQRQIDTAKFTTIKGNHESRYHYLIGDDSKQIPNLILDFKHYITIPFSMITANYQTSYLATTNELFRETISQRFTYYLSRIGLPTIT